MFENYGSRAKAGQRRVVLHPRPIKTCLEIESKIVTTPKQRVHMIEKVILLMTEHIEICCSVPGAPWYSAMPSFQKEDQMPTTRTTTAEFIYLQISILLLFSNRWLLFLFV